MSTALPRPSRPSSNAPPTISLPALPVPKTRKSTSGLPSPGLKPTPTTPKSGLRVPSTALLTPSTPAPTGPLPQPRSVSEKNSSAQSRLRKTVSISSFPQPPRNDGRIASMPPSPLPPGSSPRKMRTPTTPSFQSRGSTSSLVNGTSDHHSIPRAPATRDSDGLISVPSPPQSRSSSAQDSYSTSATQYEDINEPSPSKLSMSISEKRSSKSDCKGNVIVSVRVRPDANGLDPKNDEWIIDGKRNLIAYRGKEQAGDYYYDNVFTTHDDNAKVYDHIAKRLVRRVMEGYHGTVFAYGMTGTGKTFSMQGTASSPGVIPLAITDIFSYIRETPSREFLLRVSYLEIYNEKIHDLLSMAANKESGGNQPQEEIKLREDSKRGVYATPLKEEIVQSPTQLLRVIARGDQARRVASTQFNARSSRSHAVVQIVVESRERVTGSENKRAGMLPGGVRVSTLSLIDLAGSERAADSKERRQEGGHINKSLLTLGTVIAKLSEYNKDGGKSGDKHLPYRDSKLTRLLQGALSGNSLVSILCTISIGATGSVASEKTHTNETLNTLKFASRAKNNIVSHARRAEETIGPGADGATRALLERYRREIEDLKKQLEAVTKQNDKKEIEEVKARDAEEERARLREAEMRHEEQMLEMQLARTALKERIDHLNRLILSSKSIGVNGSFRFSQGSIMSNMTGMTGPKLGLERSASLTSSLSTIGRKSANRSSGDGTPVSPSDEDSLGEYANEIESLKAHNRALQADLEDKNRYIATLEKRLLQARRASSSRTSVGLSKGIMVGEDHAVSQLLKEKDAEIAELRARLDDKDRMLAALRSAARCRDNAERIDSRIESRAAVESRIESRSEVRNSLILDSNPGPAPQASPPAAPPRSSSQSSQSLLRQVSQLRKRTKSVDEMSRMLDEMIQDRVESGLLVRGARGSVRIAPTLEQKEGEKENGDSGDPPVVPLASPFAPPASPPPSVAPPQPPIQLQLLARQRQRASAASLLSTSFNMSGESGVNGSGSRSVVTESATPPQEQQQNAVALEA